MTRTIAILALLALSVSLPGAAIARNAQHCPPGLVKKSPACVPPGLAKKGVTAREWQGRDDDVHADDNDRYREGDRLPEDRYRVLAVGDRVIFDGEEYVVVDVDHGIILRRGDTWYHLPRPADGTDYVRAGDAILNVDRRTRAILSLIDVIDYISG